MVNVNGSVDFNESLHMFCKTCLGMRTKRIWFGWFVVQMCIYLSFRTPEIVFMFVIESHPYGRIGREFDLFSSGNGMNLCFPLTMADQVLSHGIQGATHFQLCCSGSRS
jgi:hypothetical protein